MDYKERATDAVVVAYMGTDICGPLQQYALGIARDGRTYMIGQQGVGYEVTDAKPWRWNDYWDACPTYTAQELRDFVENIDMPGTYVELNEWIDKFGARLESNFWLWHHRLMRPAEPAIPADQRMYH